MPVFVGAGTSSFMKGNDGIAFTRLTTSQRNSLTAVQGQVIFNTTTGVLEYYDGSSWAKVSAVLAVLTSVSGSIIDGATSTLTLSGEGFLQSGLVVNFQQSADSIDVNVTVTPSSDTAATVAVPASVYNNVTAGRVVTIKVTNSDGSTSQGVNKTAVALPTGGSIQTYGNYRSHTFTSSGTFSNSISGLSVDMLLVAGGGSGGVDTGGGGGAGGMLEPTGVSLNAQNYSISIGSGAASRAGSDDDGPGRKGGNSTALGYTSFGGGAGSGWSNSSTGEGMNGGSGGGQSASSGSTGPGPGSGTSGQGNNGGSAVPFYGAGGGGKGGGGGNANNSTAGTGGLAGNNSFRTGSNIGYAAGGTGGWDDANGRSSSGHSSRNGVTKGTGQAQEGDCASNTGHGGHGANHDNNRSGGGGSGICVIRYDLTAI